MAEEECKHGMDPAWCSICKAPEKKRAEQWSGSSTPVLHDGDVVARFDGVCAAECGRPIEEGDAIHYSDACGGWTHVECD